MKTIRIIAALYIIVLLTFTAKVSAQDDFTKNYKQQFQVDENTLEIVVCSFS